MTTPPRTVDPGDRVRAAHHNSVVAWLLARLRVRTGPGLSATWGEGGLMLSLVGSADDRHILPAVILAVSGADAGGLGLASQVRYTAGVLGKFRGNAPNYEGFVVRDQLPAYGRLFKGPEASIAKVRAAEVGSFCMVVRRHDMEGAATGEIWLPVGGSRGETPLGEACT